MAFFSVQLQSRCNESLHRGGPLFRIHPSVVIIASLASIVFHGSAVTFRLFIASTIYRRRGNAEVSSHTPVKLLKE